MQPNKSHATLAGMGAAIIATLVLVPGQVALSADHFDSPSRTSPRVANRTTPPDISADIADVFAFYDVTNAYFAVTFHNSGVYDRDLLHVLNISTSAPATSADISIRWRYGAATNGTGSGVSIENLPGVNGALVGPVESILSKDGVRAYAGMRDDPFFFDLLGFEETRALATAGRTSPSDLRFSNARNFFRNANGLVLIIEVPRSRLGNGPLDIHATTARFGGLLS